MYLLIYRSDENEGDRTKAAFEARFSIFGVNLRCRERSKRFLSGIFEEPTSLIFLTRCSQLACLEQTSAPHLLHVDTIFAFVFLHQ